MRRVYAPGFLPFTPSLAQFISISESRGVNSRLAEHEQHPCVVEANGLHASVEFHRAASGVKQRATFVDPSASQRLNATQSLSRRHWCFGLHKAASFAWYDDAGNVLGTCLRTWPSVLRIFSAMTFMCFEHDCIFIEDFASRVITGTPGVGEIL